ncbi:MAG: oligoribonuclease [Thermodesulfobacteriota bacterium]|nr:oligoribonuclease [Thermodesulfobacteriota bacterium]
MIWMDLEMTGIGPEGHVILEIATLVTDTNLEVVAEGPNIAIHHPQDVLATMEQWSRTHHEASGLLDRVRSSPHDSKGAEEMTLAFLALHSEAGCSPLCGNSVWQDRRFLEIHMPRLNAFLHYRNIDVSSVKELVKRWYPALPVFKKEKTHLALSDIKESIAELRYYRQHVFLPKGQITA